VAAIDRRLAGFGRFDVISPVGSAGIAQIADCIPRHLHSGCDRGRFATMVQNSTTPGA
jgi:hypothetical protein